MKSAKTIALDSIMKHPELSKILKKAIAAPQGSTIRKKARSILQSAYQASYNKYKPQAFDGQGGPLQTNFIPPTTTGGDLSSLTLGGVPDTNTYTGTLTIKSPFKTGATTTPSAPALNASGTFNLPSAQKPAAYSGLSSILGGSGNFSPSTAQPTVPKTVLGTSGNMSMGSFNNLMVENNPDVIKQQTLNVKDAERSSWQKASTVYNSQTNIGLDPRVAMANRTKYDNLQSDVKADQKLLQSGTSWGPIWNNLHTKYPELPAETIDGLLQKGKYYINGKWVPPVTAYQNVAQAAQQATQQPSAQTPQTSAPVFKAGLTDKQQTSIKNLLAKITNNGYVVKPGSADEKNLIYALGPNWQQYSAKKVGAAAPSGTTIGSGTAQTMADIASSSTPSGTPASGSESDTATSSADPYTWMKNMYDKGVGAEAAADIAMQDKSLVAKLLGVPESSLPNSLLLGDQYQAIQDSLKKSYNLDNLQNEILTRQRNGANLSNVLEDYMTERDTYINAINNTIDTAKAWFNARGADNPYATQSRDQYIGFLTTLKGGQQKRYADFLKMSTDMYGQETQALTDNYNIQKQNFEDDLANKKLATQEDYSNMKATLEGMYNAYDTILDRQAKIADLNSKGIAVAGQTASDIIDSSSPMLSTQMKDTETLKNWAPSNFSHQTITYTDPNSSTAKDAALYNEPIMTAMQTFADNTVTESGRAGDPTAVIKFYDNNIGETMDAAFSVGSSNASKMTNNYQNLIDQYLKNAYSVASTDADKAAVLENAQQLAKTLSGRVESAINGYFNTATNVTNVQNAIGDLAYEHGWFGKDTPRTNAQITPDFIAKWKADEKAKGLSDFILDSIISAYTLQTSVKDSNGKSINDSPADAFLMNTSDPNKITYYKPNQLGADYMAWNIVTKGALATLAQDTLI